MVNTKLDKLYAICRDNAYAAMITDLAQHLGVTASSLRRLGLGWLPIVKFKKGFNYQGWWVIPERQSSGEVIGLSLRSQRDMKVMFPGSKHGVIFEVNPQHKIGSETYQHGAHNWSRIADEGKTCPICRKPDGCLVSAENPSDPRAAICIRTQRGSLKSLGLGYLHILKESGRINQSASVLPSSDRPIIIVEGMTDVAVAMDLDFVAIGRPSNLACMDSVAELVRGRQVVILGENDRKENGKEPGREGMVACFQMVKRTASHVRMCMPPDSVKDLRQWKINCDLTAEDLLAYVEEYGLERSEQTILSDDHPLTLARSYLRDHYHMAGRVTLRRWQQQWYVYRGSRYALIDDEALDAPIYPWSEGKQITVENPTTGTTFLRPLRCDSSMLNNMVRAMRSETHVGETVSPCWVNGVEGPDPYDLIAFDNGILHIPIFFDDTTNGEYLLDPTPDFFTTTSLPFNFDATAQCPRWLTFLDQVLGYEPACIALLQEWAGYCMTSATNYQKLMFMRGPTAAGKSVILNVLSRLVGTNQVCSTSFSAIVGPFGLQEMVDKLLCTIGDARNVKSASNIHGLELLLNITGEDALTINRKNKAPLASHRLTCKITLASNEFLEILDHASAMLRRINHIEFKETFVGREDFHLEEKLATEIPGIAVWALRGLSRLRANQQFTLPESSKIALREWRTGTNPMAAFLEECTSPKEKSTVSKRDLFTAWDKWSSERGMRPITFSRFKERVRGNATYVSSDTYSYRGTKRSVFRGIVLKPWASKQFTNLPPTRSPDP